MQKVLLTSAVMVVVSAGLAFLPSPKATAEAEIPIVKIAVVNTLTRGLPQGIVAVAMRPLRSYMELQTGMSGEIVIGGDALELGKKLDDETYQIGVFHGYEFAWAKARYQRLEPIVVCRSTSENVRAIQVVSAKSKAERYADLKGGTLAIPRENRAYCRLYAERRCIQPGATLATFYKSVTQPAECEDALDDVVRGKIDSAVVEGALLDEYTKAKPAWARHLRILSQSEVFAPGVIACRKGKFTAKQVESFRNAMLNAGKHPKGKEVMTSLRVGAFADAPENFQAILDASIKAYPAPVKSDK